jgi:NitT/TauT family transport system permease protein
MAFAVGSIAGIACGLALAFFPRVEEVVRPVITILNSMPRVALAPLFILWWGLGVTAKTFVGISLVFFILLLNTQASIRHTDPDLLSLSRILRHSKWRVFRNVYWPAAVPTIFAGLRLASVYALLGVVTCEMVASEHGLGQQMSLLSNTFNVGGAFAILIVLALISLLITALMSLLERRLLRWQKS